MSTWTRICKECLWLLAKSTLQRIQAVLGAKRHHVQHQKGVANKIATKCTYTVMSSNGNDIDRCNVLVQSMQPASSRLPQVACKRWGINIVQGALNYLTVHTLLFFSACAGIYRQDNSCITLGMCTMGIHFQAEKETPFLINVVCLATKKQRQIHNRHQAAQRDIYDCAIAP